jgi:hypothetical protein
MAAVAAVVVGFVLHGSSGSLTSPDKSVVAPAAPDSDTVAWSEPLPEGWWPASVSCDGQLVALRREYPADLVMVGPCRDVGQAAVARRWQVWKDGAAPVFSPTAREAAVLTERVPQPGPEAFGALEIRSLDANGVVSGVRRWRLPKLFRDADCGVEWSPDGSRLAVWADTNWSGDRAGMVPESAIFVYRSDGRLLKKLEAGSPHGVRWSPDGGKLLYGAVSGHAVEDGDLASVDLATGKFYPPWDGPGRGGGDYSPTWPCVDGWWLDAETVVGANEPGLFTANWRDMAAVFVPQTKDHYLIDVECAGPDGAHLVTMDGNRLTADLVALRRDEQGRWRRSVLASAPVAAFTRSKYGSLEAWARWIPGRRGSLVAFDRQRRLVRGPAEKVWAALAEGTKAP